MNTTQHIERIKRIAAAERPVPPHIIQATTASRGGASGTAFIQATVIRGLLRADPLRADPEHAEYGLPVAGYDDYVLRLVSDGTSVWASGTTYANNAEAIGSDSRKYISQADNNTGHDPVGDGGTWWAMSDEINPQHYSRGSVDWRDFVPWYQVNEEVPLIRIEGGYVIAQQMTYVGDSHPSILWIDGDGTDGHIGAVFA